MKKNLVLGTLALSMVCLAGAAQAGTVSTQTEAGAAVTIDTDGKGPGFTASASPGVLLSVDSIKQAFTIQSMNEVAKAGNRIEYGIWSPYSGYFQKDNATDALTTGIQANETTDPFATGWTPMGGDPKKATETPEKE